MITLIGGRVIDPRNSVDERRDLHIRRGRVAASAGEGATAARVLNVAGHWVLPGLIDLRTTLFPTVRDTWAVAQEELATAAAGGFTAVCATPRTDPINDDPLVTGRLLAMAREVNGPELLPISTLTLGGQGEKLAPLAGQREAGCVAAGDLGGMVRRAGVFRRTLEYAHGVGLPVFVDPYDRDLGQGGLAHEGEMAVRLGLPPLPETVETAALLRDAEIARHLGIPLHLTRLSSARAVMELARLKAAGQVLSAAVSAHQLHFTDVALQGFPACARVSPPLRGEADRQALLKALAEGVIDAVCSDHNPALPEEKDLEFDAALPGNAAAITTVPALLHLVAEGALSPRRLVEALAFAPARILGLADRGHLGEGAIGSVTVVAPDAESTFPPERFAAGTFGNLFAGRSLRGRVVLTIVQGRVVYDGLSR